MGVVLNILNFIFNLYLVAFVIRFLISWLVPEFYNQFIQMLGTITEPVIMPIRNWWRFSPISLVIKVDISPLIAGMLLYIIKLLIIKGIGFLVG